jgi:hypothetical protein
MMPKMNFLIIFTIFSFAAYKMHVKPLMLHQTLYFFLLGLPTSWISKPSIV